MEVKKSKQANLENNKQLYFLMGLVVALAVVFTAFELGQKEIKFQDISSNQVVEEIENIEITPPDDNQAPPPPPPPAPAIAEEINVVENDVNIEQVEIISTDDNENKQQAIFAPPSAGTGRAETVQDDQIFDFLEEMPEFPGGETEMMKFLSKNVVYPTIASENGIQGRVMVGFVVERDGSVSDVKVLRGVDPSLDKEAIRVVKSMPKWKPGMQTGKPVRCRFTIPVNFRLR